MPEITITNERKVPVRYLRAECGVRYWEDAIVDGVDDENGSRIPCRRGDMWCPVIDLETGKVLDWPSVIANIHYKVCDAGVYELLDADKNVVKRIADYVPKIMAPGGNGYGDYVIMTVNGDGSIQDWRVDLSSFEETE